MSEKNTKTKDPTKKVLEDEDEKDSKPSTVINTKGPKTADDEAEGPELIPETYTKKKPALTSYDDDMSKAKAKAIAERSMGIRAIPKKKTSFKGKTDGKPLRGSVKDANKDAKNDDGPELMPETLTKKLTDDDMSKAKARAVAERSMGIRAIPKKKTSFQGKTDGKPLRGSVKDANKDAKNDDGPELIPETLTKKLTDDDMSKAKARAVAERSMGNQADDGPELIPETLSKKLTDDDMAKAKAKASLGHRMDLKSSVSMSKDSNKDAKTDDGPELMPETLTKKLTDENMTKAKTLAKASTAAMKMNQDGTSNHYDDLVSIDDLSVAAEETADATANIDYYDATENIEYDDAVLPGAVAVAGIGGGNDTNEWQTSSFSSDEDNPNDEEIPSQSPVEEGNEEEEFEEHLIKAVVVDDDAIPQAEAISEETLVRNRRRRSLCCIAGLIVIVLSIVLATVLSRKDSASKETQSPTQSSIPSMVPSELPSMSPTTSVQSFLEQLDEGLQDAFMDADSAQAKALSWLELNHTSSPIYDYSEQRIVQRFVLATLYYGMEGKNWIKSDDWLSSKDECDWDSSHENRNGRCGTSTGNVLYELKMNFNRLKGTLPREIYLLSQLTSLDLSANAIRGSLPSELGLMSSLTKISLKGNSLNGRIPTELNLLHESLSVLDVSSNSLDGSLPSTLGQLTNLEELDMSDNVLSGTICSELGTLSRITSITLADNSLSGTIPAVFESLQQLEVLELSNNLLFGSIPFLVQLNKLNIGSNFISGNIATTIGSMTRLEVLDVSNNLLVGNVPSELGALSKLESLYMSINGFTGALPQTITNLTKLETLDITRNSINGTLPANIHLMEGLEELGLSLNSVYGSLPDKISTMSNLKILNLGTNEITGILPEDLHLMEGLEILDLSLNKIYGSLPEQISMMSNLKTLDLDGNGITGTLPGDIHLMEGLEILFLPFNSIAGTLPKKISMMSTLKTLNLQRNRITGTLPKDLHLMESLELLYLGINNIHGSLPETMTMMSNLKEIDLDRNDITGTLPEDIYLMESLEVYLIAFTSISGTIPSGIGSLTNLEFINLAYNSLTGTIPSELGLLSNLDVLYLQDNDLSGSVPSEFCTMRSNNVIELFGIDCDDITSCGCCFDHCPNPPRIPNSTTALNCAKTTTSLQVAVGTDKDPQGVEWVVIDEASNEIVLQGGPLTRNDHTRTTLYETCIPDDACLVFTVRGWNTDGGIGGDGFMVHLNGSEISNGRFQNHDAKKGPSEFFLGGPSSFCTSITNDKQQACSVTHPTCESIELECVLDNIGGVSGFCSTSTSGSFATPSISPMPSFLPSASSAPSSTTAPSTSPSLSPLCTLCEDSSAPPLGSLVLPVAYYQGQTCSQLNTGLLNQQLTFLECQSHQATFGIACGCNNPIALESIAASCRVCGGTDIPRFPFKAVYGDITCLDGEYHLKNFGLACNEIVDTYRSACCEEACSKTNPCNHGYFCTFENNEGQDGVCEFCGVPSEISSTCSSSELNTEGKAECAKSCVDNLECSPDLSSIRIDVTTDVFLSEISWTLQDESSGEIITEGGNYYSADSELTFYSETFVSQECVANDSCLRFTIYESSESGVGKPGQFILYWNNNQVASSSVGFMGKSQTVRIGEACSDTDAPSITAKSHMPSFAPSLLPSSINPLLLPPCQDGMVNITVDIHIENDPQRTAWTLVSSNYDEIGSNVSVDASNSDSILLQGGPYLTTHVNSIGDVQSTCVAPNSCLELMIKDPQEYATVSSSLGMESDVLAIVNMYVDSVRVGMSIFLGLPMTLFVGNCSPIQ